MKQSCKLLGTTRLARGFQDTKKSPGLKPGRPTFKTGLFYLLHFLPELLLQLSLADVAGVSAEELFVVFFLDL